MGGTEHGRWSREDYVTRLLTQKEIAESYGFVVWDMGTPDRHDFRITDPDTGYFVHTGPGITILEAMGTLVRFLGAPRFSTSSQRHNRA